MNIKTFYNKKIVLFIIIVIITNIFLFLFHFFDIAFIFTGLKHYNKSKQKTNNFMDFFGSRRDNDDDNYQQSDL